MREVEFVTKAARSGRIHFVSADDVRIVLSRLPQALCSRLRRVHFNDRAGGNRRYGYVTPNRDEISICALPANVSLSTCCASGGISPTKFGAPSRGQWPHIAVRRFMLYDVLLHEIGHIQIVRPWARNSRRQFAGEKYAEAFAIHWRRKLWEQRFAHPDAAHHSPK